MKINKYWFKPKNNPKMGWTPISVEGYLVTFLSGFWAAMSMLVPINLIDQEVLSPGSTAFVILLAIGSFAGSIMMMQFAIRTRTKK